jgi:hypothetical protein
LIHSNTIGLLKAISLPVITRELTKKGNDCNLFFNQTGDFGLKLWEIIDNNAPDYLMGYFIISMNDSVASTNDLVSIVKLEFRICFQNPAYCFSNNLNIPFNSTLCFCIGKVVFKSFGFIGKVAFNFLNRLKDIEQPGF